ncbi:MAG: hypothetical protein MJZ84_02575 [Paludibacteraceae bacterium]|nr:hypothetical protein [Paludibacteraceae bacterium]
MRNKNIILICLACLLGQYGFSIPPKNKASNRTIDTTITVDKKERKISIGKLFTKAFTLVKPNRNNKYRQRKFDRIIQRYELEKDTTLTKQEQIQQLLNNF